MMPLTQPAHRPAGGPLGFGLSLGSFRHRFSLVLNRLVLSFLLVKHLIGGDHVAGAATGATRDPACADRDGIPRGTAPRMMLEAGWESGTARRMAMGHRVTLAIDNDDGVLVVTLNRPEKANARNQAMQSDLLSLVNEAGTRGDIRAVVLTGAGQKAFCGGMDLSEPLQSAAQGQARIDSDFALYDAMEACPKPIIAAVSGAAAGGGLDLVLASDLAIAEYHATFSCPEARLGLIPLFAMLRLPAIIGPQRTAVMTLQCRCISAREACDWGLVGEVVQTGTSLDRALAIAHEITDASEAVVVGLKLAIKRSAESMPRDQAASLVTGLFETSDFASRTAPFQSYTQNGLSRA